MKRLFVFLAVIFFVLFSFAHFLPAKAATGNTIYVDSDSPGVQDGLSWNTAWHTIQQAVNDARFSGSGNTILVAAGTYNEQVTLTSANAGVAGDSNVIKAKTGETPIIDATGTANGVGFIFGWNTGGANYITVDGFEVINGSWYGNIFAYKSHHVVIQNSIVHHNTYGGSGIYASRCDYFQSINNTVYDIPTQAPGNGGYGIYIQNLMNGIARGNTVHDVGGSGIEFECANTTVPNDYGLVENNLVYNAGTALNNNNISHTIIRNNILHDSSIGIVLNSYWNFPARLTQYNFVSGNIIYNINGSVTGSAAVSLLAQYGGSLSVSYNTVNNNLVYGSKYGLRAEGMNNGSAHATNNLFANNTLYQNTYGFYGKDYGEGNTIKNNIFTNNTNGIYIDATSIPALENYNNAYNNTTNYTGLSAGANDSSFDPLYVDAVNNNFHLQSQAGSYHGNQWINDANNSPAIDAGDPTDEYYNEPYYNGNRVNLGYEGNTIYASKTYVATQATSAPTVLPTSGPMDYIIKYLGLLFLITLSLIMVYLSNKLKRRYY